MIALVTMTVSTITALPFIVRPCKGSILVILFPGEQNKSKRESSISHYLTIMGLYIALVVTSFICVVLKFNLEEVLTIISAFTSPLVSFQG